MERTDVVVWPRVNLPLDLCMARNVLAAHGVEPQYEDGQLICIWPDDALGGYLLFHDAALDAPWRELAARQ